MSCGLVRKKRRAISAVLASFARMITARAVTKWPVTSRKTPRNFAGIRIALGTASVTSAP
jgi:hypothetical protein